MSFRGVSGIGGTGGAGDPGLAGVGGVVGLGEGLLVVLGRADHDRVDQDAGDFDLAGREHAARGRPLDLGDDHAAGVLRGLRDRQRVQGHRLMLHGDVALGVGGGAAQQSHIDRDRRQEQVVLAGQGDDLQDVLGSARVEPPALEPRVDEGADPDPGDDARTAGRDVPEPVRDHALRQAVGLQLVRGGQPAQRRNQPPVPADHAAHHARMPEVVQPAALPVALSGGEDQSQLRGRAGGPEAALYRRGQMLREADPDEPAGRDGVRGQDGLDRLIDADHLVTCHCHPLASVLHMRPPVRSPASWRSTRRRWTVRRR